MSACCPRHWARWTMDFMSLLPRMQFVVFPIPATMHCSLFLNNASVSRSPLRRRTGFSKSGEADHSQRAHKSMRNREKQLDRLISANRSSMLVHIRVRAIGPDSFGGRFASVWCRASGSLPRRACREHIGDDGRALHVEHMAWSRAPAGAGSAKEPSPAAMDDD